MAVAAIEFNTRLSLADVQHDATDSAPPVTDKGPNTLYGRCLRNLFGGIPKHPIVSLTKTAVVPATTNGNAKEFLRQFDIARGIQDMFHPYDVLGLEPCYTPSYPFDSASKSYGPYVIDGIADWWRRSGSTNPIVIPLYAYGAINVDRGATLTISVLPDNETARYHFDNLLGNTYIYDIMIATRRCECPAISNNKGKPDDVEGNAIKNRFFNTNRDKSGVAEFVIRGVGKMVVKLMGDYLHCIVCGPNDTVCTGDHYLRDRCVKNKKNCVYREHTGSKYNLHYTGETPADLRSLMNAARSAARAASRAAELEEEEQERLAAELRASIRSAKRAERISSRSVTTPSARVALPAPAPALAPEPVSEVAAEVAAEEPINQSGGNQDILKRAYLAHFTTVMIDRIRKIEECIATNVFRIKGKSRAIHADILAFLHSYTRFLGTELLQYLANRSHVEDVDTFKQTLSAWIPADILYTPNDMKRMGEPFATPAEFYVVPQPIRKIFPNQTERVSFTESFGDTFPGGKTFYEVVAGDATVNANAFAISFGPPPPHPFHIMKSYFMERAPQYRDQIISLPDPKNKSDYLVSLHRCILHYDGVDSDIVKIIFTQLIENPADAARAFDTFMNLVMFRGYYVFDYDIVSAFLRKMNEGSPSYAELEQIIEYYEVGKRIPILLEDTTLSIDEQLEQLDALFESIVRRFTPDQLHVLTTFDMDSDSDPDTSIEIEINNESDKDSVRTPELEAEPELEAGPEEEEDPETHTVLITPYSKRLRLSAKQMLRRPTGTAALNARRTLAARKLAMMRGTEQNTKRRLLPYVVGGTRSRRKNTIYRKNRTLKR